MANSILLRVAIPLNVRSRLMFERLFPGGQCVTLMEGGKVIWSSNDVDTSYQGFDIEKDPVMNLMTVHIGSDQYEFQAVWK
jgi:hypothetical protein